MANHLFRKAGSSFRKLITLSECCPNCGSFLVIEYASDPGHHNGKMLSLIITCDDRCDQSALETEDGPAEVNDGPTHWWLDEDESNGDLDAIIQSLPRGQAELVRILHSTTVRLNRAWLKTAGTAS